MNTEPRGDAYRVTYANRESEIRKFADDDSARAHARSTQTNSDEFRITRVEYTDCDVTIFES